MLAGSVRTPAKVTLPRYTLQEAPSPPHARHRTPRAFSHEVLVVVVVVVAAVVAVVVFLGWEPSGWWC